MINIIITKNMKRILFSSFFFLLLALPVSAGRENVHEWYIQDLKAEFELRDDSSLLVTERITADCGDLPGKHGIFRILPKNAKTPEGKIYYPIKLLSITDFDGHPYEYDVKEGFNTLTWKIGDPNKEVKGANQYKIEYLVKNAVREHDNFDEFYWNISGHYWDMDIDDYEAKIVFPPGVSRDNTDIYHYMGRPGSKDPGLAKHQWINDNTLKVFTASPLRKGEGVTLSASFPSGIVDIYEPTVIDLWRNDYLWLLVPLVSFIMSYLIWKAYGDDPDMKKTIIAHYEPPNGLGPLEMGMLEKEGGLRSKFITAAIIKMAVDGLLTIKEKKKKGVSFFSKDDHILQKVKNADTSQLTRAEKKIYDALFKDRSQVSLFKLKKDFHSAVPEIKKEARNFLIDNGYMEKAGLMIKIYMIVLAVIFFFVGIFGIGPGQSFFLPISFLCSGVIVIMFALFMTKKTIKGINVVWKTKGFRTYMATAEKYRAQFYEEENMFEKILPYAVAFGMTKIWIKKMKKIYDDDYFRTHVPSWYIGSSLDGFDVNSFASSMNSIASSISQSASSSTGAGGSGFSGGGGGGGGGGGW